jgi:hypothetical protein
LKASGDENAIFPTSKNCHDFLKNKIYLTDVLLDNITDNQRLEVKKDIHLIEASLATDKIVVSLDDNTARRFFTQAAKEVEELCELKAIAWVNPDKLEEDSINWLKSGANLDAERLL